LDIFAAYQDCFGWMTLLALTQGIVWALAAWPLHAYARTVRDVFLLFPFSCAARYLRIPVVVAASFYSRHCVLAALACKKCGTVNGKDGTGNRHSQK
jgi:hypothetical protein